MLTKLLPDQIAKHWEIIEYAVENSLPPIAGENPNKMNNILTAALSGKIDVWASYKRTEEGAKFDGIVLTQMLYEEIVCTRNLLIYCLFGYEPSDKNSWTDGLVALYKYAKEKKCSKIVAYSQSKYIVRISNELGADTSYTFISFDI